MRGAAGLLCGGLLCAGLLGGCAGSTTAPAETSPAARGWREVATAADRERLRGWRAAWIKALGEARGGGHGAALAAAGRMFQPDAALDEPAPPPGDYRCRVTKLGTGAGTGPGLPSLVAYPFFRCRITREGELLSLTKLDGSQRPVGLLFPDGASRLVFLGTMMLGDEARALDYGSDPERDMVGVVERMGAGRWRLVLPYPRWESTLDVMELVAGEK